MTSNTQIRLRIEYNDDKSFSIRFSNPVDLPCFEEYNPIIELTRSTFPRKLYPELRIYSYLYLLHDSGACIAQGCKESSFAIGSDY